MGTKHILIVDDKPTVAFFLSKTLERSNRDYQVSVAHSGEEALDVLNGSPVDLLVTDLCMPGISGLELIRQVRAASPHTRTILITAYGNDEVEAEARHLEAYCYITKPFDIGNFTRVVQEALSDMMVSQPEPIALPGESHEVIARQLEDLRRDIGAQCVFLANMQGQRLAEAGAHIGLDASALLSLLADGFTTTGALARHVGDDQMANLNFHAGARYEIYSTNVNADLFLAMIYDRQVQASRIGIVWVYTRRALRSLPSVLTPAITAQGQPVGRP